MAILDLKVKVDLEFLTFWAFIVTFRRGSQLLFLFLLKSELHPRINCIKQTRVSCFDIKKN